ncbi:TPA: hypothetical protein NJ543_002268 [Vibrio parahaemolyticus]|uniref:hypothetical protein n=1 Tax=Vibrio parahaemolyticus TaxID=670 RepID=UPI001120629D|nr:hypothetical protein [Vibrio parahaemolyticus]TOP44821.1 hypothetical protein CGH15_06835 [Vibrio parahaemolyticus]HCE1932626.1 hypothetical protein [Vibrio parahaemolyticus]HCG8324416.1 hypothetical protein [Vibrio parahaemolyticus]HCH0713164.1 hypothetical protein [Vibrio parahaemolyticus]
MKVLLGFVIGYILSMLFIGIYMNFKLDGALMVNIAIALGTCVGTGAVIATYWDNRKNREWEIKKEPLLRLLKAIANAMEATIKHSDAELEKMTGENPHAKAQVQGFPYRELKDEMKDLLKVHDPFFPESVKEAVKNYIAAEKNIDNAYSIGHCDILDVYDSIFIELEKLHSVLIRYVKESARI